LSPPDALSRPTLTLNASLADSFGRAGYRTIAPDLFDGKPAPEDINGTPNFNVTEFLYRHRPEITDPKIARAIDFIKTELGIDTIAATGYCFGGRYVFRLLDDAESGISASFAAHPSLLEDGEIEAITGPVSIAAAGMPCLMDTIP
jgi:dienelactone hydrolase